MSIRVSLTANDIAHGVAGDCHRCAVALALRRATKDEDTMVYEHDWAIRLRVWGRMIVPPGEAQSFIRAFDRQPRTEANHIDTGHRDYESMKPFDFELPDQDDPRWKDQCYGCEELLLPSDLDDEGFCEDCRDIQP